MKRQSQTPTSPNDNAGYEVLLKWAKSLGTLVCHGNCCLVHPVWWAKNTPADASVVNNSRETDQHQDGC